MPSWHQCTPPSLTALMLKYACHPTVEDIELTVFSAQATTVGACAYNHAEGTALL